MAQVLLVDDDRDVREMVRLLLEAHGHVVTDAANGAAAYAAAPGARPDVVVTDMRMPIMDGLELSRALRALPGAQALPIVVLSALADEDPRLEALRTWPGVVCLSKMAVSRLAATLDGLLAPPVSPAQPADPGSDSEAGAGAGRIPERTPARGDG